MSIISSKTTYSVWASPELADSQSLKASPHARLIHSAPSSISDYPKETLAILEKLSNLMSVIDDYTLQYKAHQSEFLAGRISKLRYSNRIQRLETLTTNLLLEKFNCLPGSVRRQIYILIGEQYLRSNPSSLVYIHKYGRKHYLDKAQRQILKTSLFQISCRIKNDYRERKALS
ncbi:MAG: hypothetical protein K2P51_00320 [Rhabdochlamydiaceae bacterium]|nr:hypothetical protein [Rhabdochlamydiaceae bacterium]